MTYIDVPGNILFIYLYLCKAFPHVFNIMYTKFDFFTNREFKIGLLFCDHSTLKSVKNLFLKGNINILFSKI